MLMTKTDLRQFKAIQTKLEEKQSVNTYWIKAAPAPKPDMTHGGPVFMSVGQVVDIDLVDEKATRRLEGEDSV